MNHTIKALFSLLCISTVIYSTQTQSTSSYSRYDITKLLNSSIAGIFASVDSNEVKQLINSIENLNATNFETEVACDVEPFNNTFYFSGINITVWYAGSPQINYDFFNNEMIIFNPKFYIKLEAYVGPVKDLAYAGFIRTLDFRNISIAVKKSSNNLPDNKFRIDISYDDVEFNYVYIPWFHDNLTIDEQHQLGEQINHRLPSVLTHNMNHNENFLQALNRTFCKQTSKREIALADPDFLSNEYQYYYRAQNVSSFHITLSNITINGLSNFNSLIFDDTFGYSTYILVIEDIGGRANLCYDTENATVFELEFGTQYVSISFNPETQSVFVESQNFSVIETKLNASLTERQSEWVMEGIGRAVATSIMPSMKICRDRDELSKDHNAIHPTVQLFGEISDKFHFNTINESYSNWTPFYGNYTATNVAFYPESNNYSISIHNLTIMPEFLNHYPYQMECHFFNMLQIIYNVEGNATGQIRLQNTTDQIVIINFRAIFSFADEIIKRKQNNNYEFKMWLPYYHSPFIITLSPTEYIFHADEESKIINQINDTLLSMTRQVMLNNAEPLLALPLDFCTNPDKIIDDFLPPFADYEAPYNIPGVGAHGGKHFTAKIYNITLSGLSNFQKARVAFNKNDVSNDVYDSSEETFASFVEFPIYNITGRMGFNDSSVKFNELELEKLNELLVVNATNEGKISVFPGYRYKITPVPYDPGFSCHDSVWIMDKLEDIIETSLSRKKDDLLYSILS